MSAQSIARALAHLRLQPSCVETQSEHHLFPGKFLVRPIRRGARLHLCLSLASVRKDEKKLVVYPAKKTWACVLPLRLRCRACYMASGHEIACPNYQPASIARGHKTSFFDPGELGTFPIGKLGGTAAPSPLHPSSPGTA